MRAKKRFGQHFLRDNAVIAHIIKAIHPRSNQAFVEIGPGPGVLTKALLPLITDCQVIEIDDDMIAGLERLKQQYPFLQIHHQDALAFNFDSLKQASLRIVGNLPYNISTPLLFHLLQHKAFISDMHFMLQKEVVDRICAEPNTKTYGRLSVMMQYHCQTTALLTVPASAFSPAPKVESAVVKLIPHPSPKLLVNDENIFADIVRDAFNQRRKTVRNSLKAYSIDFAALKIAPKTRAEQLSLTDYVTLSNHVTQQIGERR